SPIAMYGLFFANSDNEACARRSKITAPWRLAISAAVAKADRASVLLPPFHGSLALGHRRGYEAGYPREEPDAGKPPVRICEGKAESPSYSTTIHKWRKECQSIPIERQSIFDLTRSNPPFKLRAGNEPKSRRPPVVEHR